MARRAPGGGRGLAAVAAAALGGDRSDPQGANGMNEWLTVYGWTVAVAMFCFADKSDDRPGRVASVVMSLFWPVTLLAIVAVTAKPFAVNVYWALRQGALIRRSANSLTRV